MTVNFHTFLTLLTEEEQEQFMSAFKIFQTEAEETTNPNEYFRGQYMAPHQFLLSAFNWERSNQGPDYWNELCHKLKSISKEGVNLPEMCAKLSPIEAAKFIKNIVECRGLEFLSRTQQSNIYYAADEWIRSSFPWDETPEGADYWNNIYKRFMLTRQEFVN